MDANTIFLAIRSPLWRAHLRATLQRAPGLALLGEAPDAPRARLGVASLRPQIVLGDEETLADLAYLPGDAGGARLVLVAASPAPLSAQLRQQVGGALLLWDTPEQIAGAIRAILAPEVRARPRFTGPVAAAPAPAPVRPAARPGEQRAPDPALARLRDLVAGVQRDRRRYPRDAASRLAGVEALEQSLRLVAEAGQATAIVVAAARGCRRQGAARRRAAPPGEREPAGARAARRPDLPRRGRAAGAGAPRPAAAPGAGARGAAA